MVTFEFSVLQGIWLFAYVLYSAFSFAGVFFRLLKGRERLGLTISVGVIVVGGLGYAARLAWDLFGQVRIVAGG